MKLNYSDYNQFIKVYASLQHFAGVQAGLLDAEATVEDFLDLHIEDKIAIRNELYKKERYIHNFVKQNPYQLTKEDLQIANDFQYSQHGKFWVVSHLKKHTIFLDDKYAYAVYGLSSSIKEVMSNQVPQMVEAVLLPFKEKIVYDGILMGNRITFGGNIRASIKSDYSEAKTKYGLITSLPIDPSIANKRFGAADQLKVYMRSKASIEENRYDIEELIGQYPKLENLYIQLYGKQNTRAKKKELKELGITNYYFAIYFDTIIASGKTQKEVEIQVKKMVKASKKEAIYIFKM